MKHLLRPALLFVAALATIGASPPQDWNRVVTRTAQQSTILGNPGAKLKLTTWVSYTCPHCAEFEREAEAGLKLKYIRSGKVSVEVRHLIRDPIDLTVAMLTNCGPKDRFPLNHSAFMRGQANWIGTLARSSKAQQTRWSTGNLPIRARAIASDFKFYDIMTRRGYDRVTVDRCLADVGMAQRLAAGTEAAAKLGIDHTPSFALDGALLYGTSGWELLQPQIEARM